MNKISTELVGSVFSGLVLLIGALATYTAARSQRIVRDQKAHRILQRKFLAAMAHLFTLETDLAERGFPVPARPAILEADDDDQPPAAPAHGPRHRGVPDGG